MFGFGNQYYPERSCSEMKEEGRGWERKRAFKGRKGLLLPVSKVFGAKLQRLESVLRRIRGAG
jgi:hypothetical protein